MSQALELERQQPFRGKEEHDRRSERDAGWGRAPRDDADGFWLWLDRLFFAALGAVQGAATGWTHPSWEADDAEPARPLPVEVDAVMTRTVQVIRPDATLEVAAHRLWEHDCGALPVVDAERGRRVVGMITDRDVGLAAWSRGTTLHELRVDEVMTRDLRLCRETDSISEAHHRMREAQVRRLPVIDGGGDLAGVVTLADLVHHALRALPDTRRAESAAVLRTLAAITTPSERPPRR